MAAVCEFGASLGKSLRDHFVCGLHKEAHQKRLLSEPDLTLDKALVIAQSLETVDANARTLRGNEPALHQLYQGLNCSKPSQSLGKDKPPSVQQGRECYCCGSPDHLAASCQFVDYVCQKCQKKGHLVKVSQSHKATSRAHKTPGKESARAHHLTLVEQDEEQDELSLFQLDESHITLIQVDIQVNGVTVTMEVDKGAAVLVCVMSQQQQEELFPRAQLQPSQISLRTYTA